MPSVAGHRAPPPHASKPWMNSLKRFFEQEHGVTAIEYSLVALLVALAIIVGATVLGVNLGAWYEYIASKFPPTPTS